MLFVLVSLTLQPLEDASILLHHQLPGVHVGRQPHPEIFVDALWRCRGDRLQQLVQEVQSQVAVLEEEPAAIRHAVGQ